MMTSRRVVRILAVAPRSRGFGYVVLEAPDRLIDWGRRSTRKQKTQRTLGEIGLLFDSFRPDVLVVEDGDAASSRRRLRLRGLLRAIREFAEQGMAVWPVSRADVLRRFPGAKSKHERTLRIATAFPELAPFVPPKRQSWMTEDDRESIFDAMGMGMTGMGAPLPTSHPGFTQTRRR